jgi:periplasmic protein TonB
MQIMGTQRMKLFDLAEDHGIRKPVPPLSLPSGVHKDIFLNALLETATAKPPKRNPLEWAGALAMHVVIIAALIIIPLYATGTISLTYEETPLVAPPPPPPPAPPPPAPLETKAPEHAAAAPMRIKQPQLKFFEKSKPLIAPNAIPKTIAQGDANVTAPNLGSFGAGVPGGVPGGLSDGLAGGTGAAPPPPPPPPAPRPKPAPVKRIVHVGSELKAPKLIYTVDPVYPVLARQTRLSGDVEVDAVIDEKGNVVKARAIKGPALLIPAALNAVLQWKYEPTILNGEPVSVELDVQVHFNLGS